MSRRKLHPDVEECVNLLSLMEPVAKKAEWERLWQRHMEGEKRQVAHPEVAELLTFAGAWQAYEQHEFACAYDYLVEFLGSPQASEIDYLSSANLMQLQFTCLLFLDREQEAMQIVSQLLNAPRAYDLRSNVISLQGHLAMFFWEQEAEELASEGSTNLFYELLQRRKRKKFKNFPKQARYGDLRDLLIETSEADERARQKRVDREVAREGREAHSSNPEEPLP